MRRCLLLCWALLGCTLLSFATHALAQEAALPDVRHRVTDTTGTLTADQTARLESMLASFEQRKGSQIIVVIVPTTQPESIEQYSIRLAEKVKPGRKNVDDGLIVLVALRDHKVRIEVGSALEGPIPDSVADRVIRDIMAPSFRNGDFYGGLAAGCNALMKLIDGEPLPAPQPPFESAHGHAGGVGELLLPGFIFVVVAGGFLTAIFGRVFGSLATAVAAAAGAWLLTGAMVAVVLALVVGFLFPLILGGTLGRGRWPGGGAPGAWGGGWGGGSGWGGGTFRGGSSGGWSGGGGGFSGGGASGNW